MRLPVFQGILPIKGSRLPTDVIAGLTLAALAIPEVMGYTKISGTPVITGLYSILIPMTLFALFGSSRHLVVGADSATAAILAGGITGMAASGSAEWLALSEVLALLSAGFLIIARIIRLGFLADFLSRTVLVGFLSGVGVQVALGEISDMLGLPGGRLGPIHNIINDLHQIEQTNFYALGVSVAVLAVIVGSKKISKKIPGALIAVTAAIVAGWALNLEAYGVRMLGAVPSGLPEIGLPDVHWDKGLVLKLLPTAFAMFVVILSQSAATSRAYAARYNERFSENVDLVGLGLANVGAALSGTFVVNGSPTKTQMVDSAGGRSQLSQITTSVIVLLVLLFLTGPLASMPTAVLSAVVFLIGVELIDVKGMRKIWVQRPSEFWVALITAIVVVVVGVEQGILLAMVMSLIEHVRRSYRSKNVVLASDETGGLLALPVITPEQIRPGLLVYHFAHTMYYANAEQLSMEVVELAKGAEPPLVWFCIDASAVADVDFSAAATLREIYGILKGEGIRLVFCDVVDLVKAELDRYELTDLIGKDAFYKTISEVVSTYDKKAASDEDRN
ncbi:MAG TPA: SulP family inorganic anion transporter [Syntrophorhabdales bacterium]|nr:SulP family inorganic anion transporter [Syntrophorhabdales bacterium]